MKTIMRCDKMVAYQETVLLLLNRQGGRCAVCGKYLTPGTTELAHRIPQRKHFLKKYGERIIHHPLNLAAVCRGSSRCNNAVSIGNQPIAISKLVDAIRVYPE